VIESLQHYGTTQPLPVLVAELNKLYHEHEALGYDDTHPEIFEQLPPLWEAMIEQFYGLRRGTELDEGQNGKIISASLTSDAYWIRGTAVPYGFRSASRGSNGLLRSVPGHAGRVPPGT